MVLMYNLVEGMRSFRDQGSRTCQENPVRPEDKKKDTFQDYFMPCFDCYWMCKNSDGEWPDRQMPIGTLGALSQSGNRGDIHGHKQTELQSLRGKPSEVSRHQNGQDLALCVSVIIKFS